MFDGTMLDGDDGKCSVAHCYPETFEYEHAGGDITPATLLGVDGHNTALYLAPARYPTERHFHELTHSPRAIIIHVDPDGYIVDATPLADTPHDTAGALIEGDDWYDLTDYGLIALACHTGFEIDHYPEFAEMDVHNTSRRECLAAPESKRQLVAVLENCVALYYAPGEHCVQAYAYDLSERLVPFLEQFETTLPEESTIDEHLQTVDANEDIPRVKESQPIPHPPRGTLL